MSFWGGKRVVITGGHGFLGTHVAERLQERDCAEVFRARQRDYDLTREEDAARLFVDHPADIVIHLAGLVGGIGANKAYPADFFYRNLMMGTHTLHQAWKAGVQKLIAAGAGCGYPEDAPIPIRESDFWNGFPQIHSAPYSLAKRMLHVQSMAYWTQYRFPILVAIPGNIYGPYDNFDLEAAHVVPALVRKFVAAKEDGAAEVEVWGSGQPTRDFVYAADVAEGMLRMLEHYEEPVLLNLSSGVETSIREMVDALVEITGYPGRVVWNRSRPDGQLRRLFDLSKAKNELGLPPITDIREGLRKTVEWYQTNRANARNDVRLVAA